jgi:hypothetical protein
VKTLPFYSSLIVLGQEEIKKVTWFGPIPDASMALGDIDVPITEVYDNQQWISVVVIGMACLDAALESEAEELLLHFAPDYDLLNEMKPTTGHDHKYACLVKFFLEQAVLLNIGYIEELDAELNKRLYDYDDPDTTIDERVFVCLAVHTMDAILGYGISIGHLVLKASGFGTIKMPERSKTEIDRLP